MAELKQTGMSGCDALRKARTKSPDKIAALQTLGAIGSKATDDYEALVTAEIAGSAMPRHVAEQRLIQKYGPRLDAAQIRKSAAAADDFLAAVDEVVAKRCARTAAMAEVRKRLPALFARFQEV